MEISTSWVGGKDVWEYDPITISWTQVADWPGAAHTKMASFVVGTSGYVCTGSKFPATATEAPVREVWQYDQTFNKWTKKNDFAGEARISAVAAAINGKGYLGTGTNASNGVTQDWWQYDPATDGWVQKASLPGSKRTQAVAFAPPNANGKVYVSTGQDAFIEGNYLYDLWAYNPATDNWARRADLPAQGRGEAVGITLPTTGVVATGYGGEPDADKFNDCWQFNPSTGNWFQLPNVGGGTRYEAGGFSIGNIVYIGGGEPPLGVGITPKNDFWGLNLN
jgi:N-acetylneuraminic acid mutarotase